MASISCFKILVQRSCQHNFQQFTAKPLINPQYAACSSPNGMIIFLEVGTETELNGVQILDLSVILPVCLCVCVCDQ